MTNLSQKCKLLFTLLMMLSFIRCNISDSYRFKGFEENIDVKNISVGDSKNTDAIELISIPHLDSSHFDYTQSLSDIRFVPLQTDENSKFGEISKIFFSDDRIVVIDKRITESVFVFDNKGRFVSKIDPRKPGQHKDAATHFFNVTFYYQNQEIVLHDEKKDILYFYDKNGNFLSNRRVYLSFIDFANIKNYDKFAFLGIQGENEHLSLPAKTDLFLGEATSILKIAPNAIQRTTINSDYYIEHSLTSSTDRLFYTPVFSDTIYEVDPSTLNVLPKFKLSFPGETINSKLRENSNVSLSHLVELMNSHKYYTFKGEVFSGNDGIFYFECYKNGQLGYFYSTKSRSIFGGLLSTSRLSSDLIYMDFFTFPIASTGQEFVSTIDPDYFEFSPNAQYAPSFAKALEGFDNNSNPILVFYKIRPF